MQKFIIRITRPDMSLLQDDRLECFILTAGLPEDFAAEFAAAAARTGRLVLGDTPGVCLRFKLDGFIVDLSGSENISADFRKAGTGLKNKFSGIICRNRRHEAMIASECEPDFIIFKAWRDGAEKIRELAAWYNEMFLIQSALYPQEDGVNFRDFATDFVILNDTALQKS